MAEKRIAMFESASYERRRVTIPAYGVLTMDYTAKRPNYYRVQNLGDTSIYGGTMNIPSPENHDFTVGANKVKMHAEPFARDSLYLYNPGGSPVEVVVLSFAAAFDPVTLAMTEMEIDLSGTVLEARTVISGFNSPLPSGSNLLGKVQVSNPTDLSPVVSLLREISDKLTDAEGVSY